MIQALALAAASALAPFAAQAAPPLPLPPEGARDATAAGFAFAEVRTERTTFHQGEPIHVAFRFGFEAAFLGTNLVPLFRQPMDVPVQWEVPWVDGFGGFDGAEARPGADDPSATRTFVLNEALTRANEVLEPRVDGRKFRTFELRRTYFATAAGELALPASRLRFAYATRFGEHAFADDVAEDPAEAFVLVPPRVLRILALPDEGRPPGFTGAVGRLTLRTELGAKEVEQGASVRLALHVAGDLNLERFAAPELVLDDGWRVLGRIERTDARERTIEYDLAPRRVGAQRVPQVEFAYFDTQPPAGYRVLHSEALSIRVLAAPAPDARPPAGEPERPSPTQVAIVLAGASLLVVVVVLAVVAWLRRARGV